MPVLDVLQNGLMVSRECAWLYGVLICALCAHVCFGACLLRGVRCVCLDAAFGLVLLGCGSAEGGLWARREGTATATLRFGVSWIGEYIMHVLGGCHGGVACRFCAAPPPSLPALFRVGILHE